MWYSGFPWDIGRIGRGELAMKSSTVAYFMFMNFRTGVPVLFSNGKDDGPEYLSCFILVIWWVIAPR